jgi:hypothetical protein
MIAAMQFRIVFPFVLYGCETWSIMLREEHRLRVFENKFGPKREEVIGGWRKVHNEELSNLHPSLNIGWPRSHHYAHYTTHAHGVKQGVDCM